MVRFLIFSILILFLSGSVLGNVTYCPQVIFQSEKIKFSETEIQLFCGDPSSHAYRHIPAYEAQFVIKGFLQSRGYLAPQFSTKEKVLYVKIGPLSKVKKIRTISENKNLAKKTKRDLKRLYQRRELSTSMLNSIESEAVAQLRRRGYPCGKVTSEVDTTSDTVTVVLDQKEKHIFGPITREEVKGVYPEAFERFAPMTEHQRFDGDLLSLNEKRLLRSEVVQGTYFLENCSAEKKTFSLEQKFIPGPPRTLRFGAGASTEVGPMARARWSHNRWGPMASLLSANVEASLRSQSLNLSSDYFAWRDKPRQSVLSQFEMVRESQFKYEQFVTRIRPQMKWTDDVHNHGTTLILGPSYENGTFHSQNKSETRTFSTGVLEGSFQRLSHDYELFDVHPESGDQEAVSVSYRSQALGFTQSLLRVDTTAVTLGRLTNSGRGAIIGGLRLKAGTSFTKSTTDLSALPPEVKFFGGGSDDIRGYLLKTLPRNDGRGALTRAVLKGEIRRTHFFHEKVEAFAFTDGGSFGRESWSIDSRLWYSPGLGIRWLSPIGVVQGYWARALATAPVEDFGNFFFAGLGGVF